MQLVLITGLSGSGKSVALNALEDSGYYCVDNLPGSLLLDLAILLKSSHKSKVAVSIDSRNSDSIDELIGVIRKIWSYQIKVVIIFLNASNEVLVKRFSETRRRHPLVDQVGTLTEAFDFERDYLSILADCAYQIDTSEMLSSTLRRWVLEFLHQSLSQCVVVVFESFGFKRGIPLDADYVFDVRCLPNPFYQPDLKELTGLDAPVRLFLDQSEIVGNMFNSIKSFLETWLPQLIWDNRNYITVAIGCTGGHHRSVYLVEKLGESFAKSYQTIVRHHSLTL